MEEQFEWLLSVHEGVKSIDLFVCLLACAIRENAVDCACGVTVEFVASHSLLSPHEAYYNGTLSLFTVVSCFQLVFGMLPGQKGFFISGKSFGL